MSQAPSSETVLKALLLSDLVESTRLVERLGDLKAAEIFARHDRLARDLLQPFGGQEVDKSDGFLLLFDSPYLAVNYALTLHRALETLSAEVGEALEARAGIHVGQVLLRRNTAEDIARGAKPVEVEGLAKPTVARLMSLAGPRQTLLTRTAFDVARRAAVGEVGGDRELRWLAHGPYLFKGVEEPEEVFEVGEPGFAQLAAPQETDKVHRAVAAGDEVTLGWRPAPGQEVPQRSHWVLGERLGEAEVQREVWVAEHSRTHEKRVFKFCLEVERLRMLRREVTVFRLLKEALGTREDIARILDWNFEEAPYFLESEYTEGGSFVEWAAEQGGIAEVPLAVRLELVAQAAEALAAAHSVGVLHKDVKPSNVLITTDLEGRPRVRITDFGIGQVVDRELLSARGITASDLTELVDSGGSSSTAGTFLYMAPEVLEGRIATTQSDIYSLGVMLFQVVVGNFLHALAPGWQREVEDDLLREDVALSVDGVPERRPASASEVAKRLRSLPERRREREAEAREAADRERAQRRRRVLRAVAGAASIFLVVVSLFAFQAERARRETAKRQERAEALIGFMIGDLRSKLQPLGKLEILDDIGDQALQYFGSFSAGELSDEELFRWSEALRQIGEVRINQGDLEAAMEVFEESLALAESLVSHDPANLAWQNGLGQSHYWIGYVHWSRGELDAVVAPFEKYLEIAEMLVAEEPEEARWRLELAYARSNLGSLQEARGELESALEAYRAALEIKTEIAEADPEDLELRYEVAVSRNSIGVVLDKLGDLEGALEEFRADLAIKKALVEADPENAKWRRYLGTSHNWAAQILSSLGEHERAAEASGEAVALFEALVADEPTNTRWRRELAVNRICWGEELVLTGRTRDAGNSVEQAAASLETLVAQAPAVVNLKLDLAWSYTAKASVLSTLGQEAPAWEAIDRGLEILEALLAADAQHHHALRWKGALEIQRGRLEAARGRQQAARASWERAAATLESAARDSTNRRFLAPWAVALLHLDRLAEARTVLQRLLDQGYRHREVLDLARRKGLAIP